MPNIAAVPEISVPELQYLLANAANFLLLDVRNAAEAQLANLGGRLIPLPELPTRLHELDPEQYTIVYCTSGNRSKHAAALLLQHGFKQVTSLAGGMTAWAAAVPV